MDADGHAAADRRSSLEVGGARQAGETRCVRFVWLWAGDVLGLPCHLLGCERSAYA